MRLTAARTHAMRVLAFLGRGIAQAVVPSRCAFCGADRPSRRPPICEGCRDDLPWIEPQFELPQFACALAPLDYTFPIDAAIKMYKFRRKLFYAPAFAHLLQGAMAMLPSNVDAILPVPLHWRRNTMRGFNQALEIARPLARHTSLPILHSVVRCRATPFQSGLAAAHRQRNLNGAFRLRGKLSARHVVIVDDVITTGATCRALGKLLMQSGIEEVSALAIARVRRD